MLADMLVAAVLGGGMSNLLKFQMKPGESQRNVQICPVFLYQLLTM